MYIITMIMYIAHACRQWLEKILILLWLWCVTIDPLLQSRHVTNGDHDSNHVYAWQKTIKNCDKCMEYEVTKHVIQWFAKLKPSKLVLTINKLLADLLIRQTFFAKRSKRVNSPNFSPAKLSRYTVIWIHNPTYVIQVTSCSLYTPYTCTQWHMHSNTIHIVTVSASIYTSINSTHQDTYS